MKYLTSFMIAYIHISKYDRFDESKKKNLNQTFKVHPHPHLIIIAILIKLFDFNH